MRTTQYLGAVLSMSLAGHVWAQSNIDPEHKWAWSENCGWTNWQHDAPEPGDGVFVTPTYLAGFVWGENIGWINVGNGDGPYANDMEDSSMFGVNLDLGTGELSGFAWAENVGWINFGGGAAAIPPNAARLEGCRFRGFVWGENIGWINLDDDEHFIQVEGIACNDGQLCTENDVCGGGTCAGTPFVPASCDDLDVCTDDGCDPAGNAGAGACTNTNNTASCNDGLACNEGETCTAGVCGGGSAVDCTGVGADDCNDPNTCDPAGAEGNCDTDGDTINEGGACDDGQLCTENNLCKGGTCAGDEVRCPADSDGDCDVDAADLAGLLGDWGPCPPPCAPEGEPSMCPASCTPEMHAETCPADLSGDCDVEAFDLAILLGSWGSCLE